MCMKDGYYLSAYISVDKIGNLYKLISNRHDMAIALWKKDNMVVTLVRYWEIERLSRIKHHDVPFYDEESAKRTITELLSEEGLRLENIIKIWGCPKLGGASKYGESEFYYHSISHLFSSLLIDTDIFYNNKILSLALDLKSDNETETRRPEGYSEYVGCYSDCGSIKYFNISSPAILWSICKNELGMQEGSLMALATATKCSLKKPIRTNLSNGFEYPNYTLGYKIYNDIFGALTIDDVIDMNSDFSIEENLISAGMKEINRITVDMMEKQIKALMERYSIKPRETYLSISGGFGLNCPTNSHLLRTYQFKGFLGPPCMDDSGEALGMGLYHFYLGMKRFKFKLAHAFYGKAYVASELILGKLKDQGYIKEISDLSADVFVDDLQTDILVWYDSSAEIGPRALGHRSILGDPRIIDTKDRLNKVKQRQFWRPIAPIILRECVSEWFYDDIDSPFMLHTSLIKEDKRALVPAILHYDGTARLQTIGNQPMCETLYHLVKRFYEVTGVPIVCNTSLNDKGEPIINTPSDAIRFALNKGIEIVYINRKRVKVNLDNRSKHQLSQTIEIEFSFPKEIRQKLMCEENPYGLIVNELIWRNTFGYDIKSREGAHMLRRGVKYIYKHKPEVERLFDLELQSEFKQGNNHSLVCPQASLATDEDQ